MGKSRYNLTAVHLDVDVQLVLYLLIVFAILVFACLTSVHVYELCGQRHASRGPSPAGILSSVFASVAESCSSPLCDYFCYSPSICR